MRVIARIDIKNEFVIKGIHLEGLRKLGDPNEFAINYYQQGVDEIVFMDAVASLYDRNNCFAVVEKACRDIFIPITLGGGIRHLNDIERALHAGADKVAINTGFVRDPAFVEAAAMRFGNQCIVASIEAKKTALGWQAYIDNGRDATGLDVMQWATLLQNSGAGELLITSVDQEGTKRGFDTELVAQLNAQLSIPVIVSGGCGDLSHIEQVCKKTQVGALAFASVLHYKQLTVGEIKQSLAAMDIEVRLN